MPIVTASIVVHGSPASQLAKVLGCLEADGVSHVFVIDNSNDDRLRPVVQACGICTYRHVENRGFGAGHNIGIALARNMKSDFHVVLNADVCWSKPVIGPITAYLDAHHDTVMLGPKVYYPDGILQYSCRMLPTPADLICKRFLPSVLTAARMRRYLLADISHDEPFECSYLLGSFLFFRMSALTASGGFDERFFMYPEDIDITRRMTRLGKVLYWPEVSITHEHAAASRHSARMLRIHIVNMFRYFNKWGWLCDKERRIANRKMKTLPATANPEAGRG